MQKYIQSITALNNVTLNNQNSDEIDRYAESDLFWAAAKGKKLLNRTIKKGSVYQFEFGKNYVPEMSYEHRGLVIGMSGKLLYVLPIYSYNASNPDHQTAFHPTDAPQNVKSNLFLLKASEFTFLRRDSVLKLNDIRTVSFARIKYKQQNGYIDPAKDVYQAIERMTLEKYFYHFVYQFDKCMLDNAQLQQQISQLKADQLQWTATVHAIKEILESSCNEENWKCLRAVIGLSEHAET